MLLPSGALTSFIAGIGHLTLSADPESRSPRRFCARQTHFGGKRQDRLEQRMMDGIHIGVGVK
jgi:hypothetical protein